MSKDIRRERTGRDNKHVAVVDLGSNSVRLVVYDELSRAPFPRFNEKSLCRLGASLDADGNLGKQAMDAVARAVERFVAIARAMDVGRIDLLATEAIRKAGNGDVFRRRLEEIAEQPITILGGDDEARLAATGVVAGFHRPQGLAGDLGGGSLEIAELVSTGEETARVSMPLGALVIARPLARDRKEAKRQVDETLRGALTGVVRGVDFHVVGGGWRALAKVFLAEQDYPVPVVHGLEIDPAELRALAKRLWNMDAAEVADVPGVPGRRASTLPAAALMMDRVLKHLQPSRVLFSSLGVREGWLHEQLTDEERALDPLLAGCRQLALETVRVPAFAAALERWTDKLFLGETADQHRLRIAATLLSDIAWREARDVQSRHVFDRILRFPFIGVTHPERVFLAATVHARHGARAAGEAMTLLSDAEADRAHVLGTALLLGHRFSGSVPSILDHASLDVDAKRVTLAVDEETRVPDSEAVQGRLSLLAKAMGRDKTAVVTRS